MRGLPLDVGVIHFVGIGGIGMSGIGREGGDYALEFHSDLKTLQILEDSTH